MAVEMSVLAAIPKPRLSKSSGEGSGREPQPPLGEWFEVGAARELRALADSIEAGDRPESLLAAVAGAARRASPTYIGSVERVCYYVAVGDWHEWAGTDPTQAEVVARLRAAADLFDRYPLPASTPEEEQ